MWREDAFAHRTGAVYYLQGSAVWSAAAPGLAARVYRTLPTPVLPDGTRPFFAAPVALAVNADASVMAVTHLVAVARPARRLVHVTTFYSSRSTVRDVTLPGRSPVFLGDGADAAVALLADDGRTVALHTLALLPGGCLATVAVPAGWTACELVPAPHHPAAASGPALGVFVRSDDRARTRARLVCVTAMDNYAMDSNSNEEEEGPWTIVGGRGEAVPRQVVWQHDGRDAVGAVLVGAARVVLVERDLRVRRVCDLARTHPHARVTSLLWAGWALLLTTETHVHALLPDGATAPLLVRQAYPLYGR